MQNLEKNLVAQYDLTNLPSEEEFNMYDKEIHGFSSYDSYVENEAYFMFEDFCEQIGERMINMKGKVLVKGYNLNWQGRNGQKVVEVDISDASFREVGKEFLLKIARDIEYAYLYHVGKYDTKKSFELKIPTHDCVMFFEVKRQA